MAELQSEASSTVLPADLRRRLRAESWQRAKQVQPDHDPDSILTDHPMERPQGRSSFLCCSGPIAT